MSKESVIKLVENRGIPNEILKYNNLISTLFTYVQNQMKRQVPKQFGDGNKTVGNFYEILIPFDLLKGIQFIETLQLTVKVYDFINTKPGMVGTGDHLSGNKQIIDNNGKLNAGIINVNTTSYNGGLIKEQFYSVLYHELTHLYETYIRLKKNSDPSNNKQVSTFFQSHKEFNTAAINQGINSNDMDIVHFCFVSYLLFIRSEKNAHVASVYGQLRGMNSQQQNFNKDIKETTAYKKYEQALSSLGELSKLEIGKWQKFIPYLTKPFNEITDLNTFRETYLRMGHKLVNDYIHRIGKTAGYYYDEKRENKNESVININPGLLSDKKYIIY